MYKREGGGEFVKCNFELKEAKTWVLSARDGWSWVLWLVFVSQAWWWREQLHQDISCRLLTFKISHFHHCHPFLLFLHFHHSHLFLASFPSYVPLHQHLQHLCNNQNLWLDLIPFICSPPPPSPTIKIEYTYALVSIHPDFLLITPFFYV